MTNPENAQHNPDVCDEPVADPTPPPRPHGIGSRRAGSSTYTVTNGPYVVAVESRLGLTLEALLDGEAVDYRRALEGAIGDACDPAEHAGTEEDRAVWSASGRLLALLRATEDGSLEVIEMVPGQTLVQFQ